MEISWSPLPQISHHLCKKLALRGDELPANLHAAERRLDLPRRTCSDHWRQGDTIFGNEVQPKPTSPGHDYRRSSPNRNTSRSGILAIRRLSPAILSLCRHGYNSSPPLIFMRRHGLQSMTPTLPYTAKYNSSPLVTGLYKYSTQYLQTPPWRIFCHLEFVLCEPPCTPNLSHLCRSIKSCPKKHCYTCKLPTLWLHLQLCTLLFHHHNLCQANLDSSPAKQQLNLTLSGTALGVPLNNGETLT
jgi:hypothetical protein